MDQSLYEKASPSRQSQRNGFCFGRITRVYPEERLCEVKTFMGTGNMDDVSVPKCQWINMDSHPEGDESTNIPRVNSYGLVFFIEGQPFIFGFFSPLTGTGSASVPTDDKEQLNEGDRILKTIGRNKIILRAHGEVEVHSTDVCRSIYFPDRNILNTLCRNYEFRTDGGTQDWINIEDSGNTVSVTEYRTDIKRTNLIIEEKGYVTGEIISRTSIGAGSADGITQPVWTRTILRTGETEFFIRAPGAATGHKLTIKPDGTTRLEIAGKTSAEIKASGETTLDVGPGKAILNITPDGAVTLTNEGPTKVTSKGNIEMTTDGELKATSKGSTTVNVGGNVTIEAKGKGKFKANQIEIDGGGTLEGVLTSPNTVSQFTGLPLQPFSQTVKASI